MSAICFADLDDRQVFVMPNNPKKYWKLKAVDDRLPNAICLDSNTTKRLDRSQEVRPLNEEVTTAEIACDCCGAVGAELEPVLFGVKTDQLCKGCVANEINGEAWR